MNALSDRAAADVVAALGVIPENVWDVNDDGCDCTFQRVGMWSNPYIGKTLEVRMCCIWAELYKLFPQYVRETDAYLHGNEWIAGGPMEWDGEADMPRSIFYRQRATADGTTVAEARAAYAHRTPPKGTPKEAPPAPPAIDPIAILFEMVGKLALEVKALREERA